MCVYHEERFFECWDLGWVLVQGVLISNDTETQIDIVSMTHGCN